MVAKIGHWQEPGGTERGLNQPYGFELDALCTGLAEPRVLSHAGSKHGTCIAGLQRDDKLHAVDRNERGILAWGHDVW